MFFKFNKDSIIHFHTKSLNENWGFLCLEDFYQTVNISLTNSTIECLPN